MFQRIKVLMIFFLVLSCQSTDIYFDIKSQSIVSCNDRILKRLIIECDSLNPNNSDCVFDLSLKDKKTKDSRIEISEIVKLYRVKKKDTIFYPNNCYKITFIGSGDDGYTELKIWFDSYGKVYKTNKSNCN